MLLIDAVYINNSGGLELLFTLISKLESLDIDVHYLLDSRCEKTLYSKIVRGRYSFSDPFIFIIETPLVRYCVLEMFHHQ